jgi:hypothetical protein
LFRDSLIDQRELLDATLGIAAILIYRLASLVRQYVSGFLGLGRSFLDRTLCPNFDISQCLIPLRMDVVERCRSSRRKNRSGGRSRL